MTVAADQYAFEEVNYDVHHDQYAAPFLIEGNPENNRYFVNQARQSHILGVNQALLKLTTDALLLLPLAEFSKLADQHFRFGVMRRLRMITTSFRSFQSFIMPERSAPLTQEQSDTACRDLNAIYIDLLGLLDNYAWVLVFQHGEPATKTVPPMAVGLFKDAFKKDACLSEVYDELAPFSPWERDVKTRRNPAAHRIPLYVPTAALTVADIAEQDHLDRLISEAHLRADFPAAVALGQKARQLGTFMPMFLHDPEEPTMEIFPTVPADIGQAIGVGRIVQAFLRRKASATA